MSILVPAANHIFSQRCAVNRRVCPYFDIVLDFDDTHLRDLDALCSLLGEAEPIAPDDHSCVENDTVSKPATRADRDLRIQDAVFAQYRPVSDDDAGMENTPFSDNDFRSDIHLRENRHVRPQPGAFMHGGQGTNSPVVRFRWIELQ